MAFTCLGKGDFEVSYSNSIKLLLRRTLQRSDRLISFVMSDE